MADADFERAFGSLAYAELEQKAPGLFPYLVGFQLVKKTDDETHAIGVFGFKVGDQWYYGPVFWLNGKIKGYDLLYIVSQDLFVPMQESWINYITNRKPYVMGEPQEGTPSELNFTSPDFTPFVRSPLRKGAAIDEGAWYEEAFMYKSPKHEKYAHVSETLDLSKALDSVNPELVTSLLATMNGNTKFAEAVYKFYSPTAVMAMSQSAKKALIAKSAADNFISGNDVKVIMQYDVGNKGPETMDNLSAKEREQLVSGDVVVKDTRDEKSVSQLYAKPDFERTLTVPNQSGLWDILLKNGTFKTALVVCGPYTIGKSEHTGSMTVAIPEDKEFSNVSAAGVHARNRIDPGQWANMFKGFRTVQSIKVDDIGMIVDKNFIGTQPFRVARVSKGEDGVSTLCVVPYDRVSSRKGTSFLTPMVNERTDRYGCSPCGISDYVSYSFDSYDTKCDEGDTSDSEYNTRRSYHKCDGHHIMISPSASGFNNLADTLIVSGTSAKFIPLGRFEFKAKKKYVIHGDGGPEPLGGNDGIQPVRDDYDRKKGDLDLGSAADIEEYLFKSSMIHDITVKPDSDSTISINFRDDRKRRLRKNAAMKYLVEDIGLREDSASILVKQGLQTITSGLVKFAESALVQSQPSASYDSVYKTVVQQPNEQVEVLSSNAPGINREESMEPIDPDIQMQAEQAATQGQKDVFDLSVLQGLIRTSDIDGSLQEMVKDIILGNDRVGRILFMYYWHFDQFTEKYGDEDMKELEDTLRNVFKSTGDLILFIKQKSIEPGASERATVDIGEAPAAAGI